MRVGLDGKGMKGAVEERGMPRNKVVVGEALGVQV